jgi:hypothetical protein
MESGTTGSRANRLASNGVEAAAHIVSMTATGEADDGGSREFEVGLTVRPGGEDAYTATTRQFIHPSANFGEGMDVTVKVDPDDAGELILWDAV